MRIVRTMLVAVSATVLGGALVISATGSPASVSGARGAVVHAQLTASFLSRARAALIKDLRTPDTAMFVRGTPAATAARNSAQDSSYNWAGYADLSATHGAFTKVSGAWAVPKLTCTKEDRITSEWVGLDGFNDGTVEQDGTSSQCFEGTPVYYSWYEMYPSGTVEVGTSVAAGDSVSASVTRSGANYTLKLTDSTHPANSFSEAASCSTSTCLDTSAEWIAERPAYATTGIVPEAQFTTVKFSSASETASGRTSSISGFTGTNYDITCIDSTDEYDIVSNSSVVGGNSFTSAWKNSY